MYLSTHSFHCLDKPVIKYPSHHRLEYLLWSDLCFLSPFTSGHLQSQILSSSDADCSKFPPYTMLCPQSHLLPSHHSGTPAQDALHLANSYSRFSRVIFSFPNCPAGTSCALTPRTPSACLHHHRALLCCVLARMGAYESKGSVLFILIMTCFLANPWHTVGAQKKLNWNELHYLVFIRLLYVLDTVLDGVVH